MLEVVDEFCPWNEGRWEVSVDGAERTDAEAELAMPVESLGSAYLGGFSFGELARAGRVEELRRARSIAQTGSSAPTARPGAPRSSEEFVSDLDEGTAGCRPGRRPGDMGAAEDDVWRRPARPGGSASFWNELPI